MKPEELRAKARELEAEALKKEIEAQALTALEMERPLQQAVYEIGRLADFKGFPKSVHRECEQLLFQIRHYLGLLTNGAGNFEKLSRLDPGRWPKKPNLTHTAADYVDDRRVAGGIATYIFDTCGRYHGEGSRAQEKAAEKADEILRQVNDVFGQKMADLARDAWMKGNHDT